MRINQYIAQATGLSRRAADQAITNGRVLHNNQPAVLGDEVSAGATISLDGKPVAATTKIITIMLNKPPGYVCSRAGQGSATVYDLLPPDLRHLKPVGRLDKDSSGLLLLTNDGQLANQLTHPSYAKTKLYDVTLDEPLTTASQEKIRQHQVNLDDGPSGFNLQSLDTAGRCWQVSMQEGRNRQIRRTFEALGYQVQKLHRHQLGNFKIGGLKPGQYRLG